MEPDTEFGERFDEKGLDGGQLLARGAELACQKLAEAAIPLPGAEDRGHAFGSLPIHSQVAHLLAAMTAPAQLIVRAGLSDRRAPVVGGDEPLPAERPLVVRAEV